MLNDKKDKSWLSSLINYGKWYFISSVLTKGLSVLLLPIYTRYLSPEDFGVLQSLNSIAIFLPILLSCSLDSAIARYYHNLKHDNAKLAIMFSTIFWFVTVYGIAFLVLFFLTSSLWITPLLKISVYPLAYLAFIPALLNQLVQLGRAFLEQSLETRKITILDVLSAIINGGISILLLIDFGYGVEARLIGIFISSVFLLFCYTHWFYKHHLLQFVFSYKYLYEYLRYSFPLIPAMAGSWIASLSDRLVIAKYTSLYAVGIYSLAYQLSYILYIMGDACTRVLGPLTMSGLVERKEETKRKISRLALVLLALMLQTNLCVFLFSKEILSFVVGASYQDSYSLIPVLGFVFIIGMKQRFPMQIISFYKKTWIISLGSILMGGINLLCNLIFVSMYGYLAAAYVTVFSSLFYACWIFFFSQKMEYINYNISKILFLLVVYFTFTLLGGYLDNGIFSWITVLMKIFIAILVFVIFGLIIGKNQVLNFFYRK